MRRSPIPSISADPFKDDSLVVVRYENSRRAIAAHREVAIRIGNAHDANPVIIEIE